MTAPWPPNSTAQPANDEPTLTHVELVQLSVRVIALENKRS